MRSMHALTMRWCLRLPGALLLSQALPYSALTKLMCGRNELGDRGAALIALGLHRLVSPSHPRMVGPPWVPAHQICGAPLMRRGGGEGGGGREEGDTKFDVAESDSQTIGARGAASVPPTRVHAPFSEPRREGR